MDRRQETLISSTRELARRYSELQHLRKLVAEAEKRRAIGLCGRRTVAGNVPGYRRRTTSAAGAAIERSFIVNIINSRGIHVGEVRGGAIFDLGGRKLYALKGINIYRLSGELVGHLPHTPETEKRLDRSADRLFPIASTPSRQSEQTRG
jgi:hypothetical protein